MSCHIKIFLIPVQIIQHNTLPSHVTPTTPIFWCELLYATTCFLIYLVHHSRAQCRVRSATGGAVAVPLVSQISLPKYFIHITKKKIWPHFQVAHTSCTMTCLWLIARDLVPSTASFASSPGNSRRHATEGSKTLTAHLHYARIGVHRAFELHAVEPHKKAAAAQQRNVCREQNQTQA